MNVKRFEVLGVPVDCVTMEEAVDWADSMMMAQHPCAILAVNPEKVIRAQQDGELLKRLRSADLLIPDGIGIVLALRLFGLGRAERVPGADLMPRLCERAARKGYKVFLFGASPEVNESTTVTLRSQYPAINIVGARHGYVKEEDMPALIADINGSHADLLFIALGSPKQELWMTKYLPLLNVKVCQGVGGTFDVIAGRVARAPLIFRTMHLEWFYRLITQPSRILRQTVLPLFAFHVLRKRVLG